MTTVNAHLKIAATVASASVMLIFTEVTLSTLIPILVGVSLIILSVGMSYRPPAVVGILTILAVSALATDIATLTDARNLFAATVSLYVPSLIMMWAALSAERDDDYELRMMTRPFGRFVIAAIVCLLSVPVFAVVLGILQPSMSMRLSTMAEMSLLLLVTSTTAFLLARSSPDSLNAEAEAEQEISE